MAPGKPTVAVLARHHAWWAFLALGAAAGALYLFVPPLRGNGALADCLGLYALAAVVSGVRMHRPRARSAWWLFVGGLALLWLGEFYTHSVGGLLGIRVRFPSVADGFGLLMYPVVIAGVALLVRRRNQRADGPGAVDALIMTLGLGLVSATVLIAPYLHGRGVGTAPQLVAIGYSLGDTLLVGAGIRLAVDGGKRRPAFYLLIAGMVAMFVGNDLHGVLMLHHAYRHQAWVDAGWLLFLLCWGSAALHPSMRELAEPEAERQPRLTSLRLFLLAAATLVGPTVAALKVGPLHKWDLLFTLTASILLFGLVLGRMAGLLRARERSAARERALSAAGGLLVAATAPQEIIIATLQAVADFGEEAIEARLCRLGRDQDGVIAIDHRGALGEWTISKEVAALLQDRDAGTVSALPAYARDQLRLPELDAPVMGLELRPGGAANPMLMLVVSGEAVGEQETRYALRTLAHQVALALGSAELAEEVHRQASESRFSTLVQNSTDLITVLAADNTILYQSPSIERVLGYTAEEVIGRSFEDLLHPDEQGRMLRRLTDGAGATGRPEVIECLLQDKDGDLRHYEILHTDLLSDPAVGGIVLNGRDISERKKFEEQLAHQAFHDPVTHLANRALFNERVRHAVARTLREGVGMAVLFVDLDDFKTVNDSLGHAAGDRVLIEAAQRISASVRAADTAARFGGDEFAILLEDVNDLQHAAETAQRVLDALSRPIQLEHNTLTVRASLGISVAEPGKPTDADEMIRNADAAMYIAKSDGKAGYRIFEPAMHEQVVARLELRADLERALDQSEFELHYQPLVRLADGAVTGVEALLRWRHPTRGLVPPLDFIPFAEESGLIIPIGRWVLREGCRQARAFRDQMTGPPLPTVGINLSVKQLFGSDIVADVSTALAWADLEPAALTLEITESVMMTDTELAVAKLNELRALGVRLAMDDFGTGYSSLSYLSLFPLDILKMDRSLLAAGAAPVTSGLASAVLGLGETFELEVVAEGIEYPEQSATLRELGCETGQGFYFARPMEPVALLEYLRERAGDSGEAVLPTGA
ncbi:MAG TPA: EAL domain-containing protein [Solirubrobacteraceae bacterium]|nr:EAL domain-containing protein [Solirubrobacteraceae bacterium]